MKHSLFSATLLLLVACNQNPNNTNDEKMNYPQTRMDNTVDTYFGTQVSDPYRWLEDDRSAETAQWVKAQNDFTFGYLSKIPYRQAIKEKLEKLWNYEKLSAPFTEGDYTYYYKNDGLQNQSVLYRKDKGGKEEIFLNPNTFSKDGTTSLGDVAFSEDGSLVAYLISEGGSDWRKGIVLDAKTKKRIGDTLVDIKFSSIAWKGNEGFFYSSYDKPKGSELSAKTDQHKLYYHKLGTSQKSDKLIFGGTPAEKYRYVSGTVSNDGKYLFISVANATSGNKLFVKDLSNPKSSLVTITNNFDGDTGFVNNQGTTLFLETNINAPNGRLVKVDFKNPQPEHWQDVIPETKNVLSITTAGKYLFAKSSIIPSAPIRLSNFLEKIKPNIVIINDNINTQNNKLFIIFLKVSLLFSPIARDNIDDDPTPINVATPVLKYVNGIETPIAVIASCPKSWPANIPSINGYKPITIIPIIAGTDSLSIILNGVSVSNSLLFVFIIFSPLSYFYIFF